MKAILSMVFAAITAFSQVSAQHVNLTPQEAETIGKEAYIYGYPLITMELTRRVMTNTVVPENDKAPMGRFYNKRTYPNASFKDVTAPNADTLYSIAWLDLTKEPYVLHVPDEKDRYYLMPILSAWTNVINAPGTRTTGTKAGNFAITGPAWTGKLPDGVTEIKSPTNLVWILGRTYCTGTPEDYTAVHKIQDEYSLVPLSSYGKPYTPPRGVVNSSIDTRTPVRDQVNKLGGTEYFKLLAALLKDNPPATEDAPIIAKLAKIGVVPGKEFNANALDPRVSNKLQEVPKLALAEIAAHKKDAGKETNGWVFSLKTGTYGTDYLQRAYIAMVGLGANLPEDAVYPTATVDADGKTLNGANEYVIHFEKGEVPPVKGFWSLTMYNDKFFFVENNWDRYTLSSRDKLKYNEDGSLDLYIRNSSPGNVKESNWLPSPKGDFILMLRAYWPEESLLDGKWTPPAIKKV